MPDRRLLKLGCKQFIPWGCSKEPLISVNCVLVLLTAHFQFSLVDWLDGVSDDVYFLGHVIDLTFDVLFCHSSPFLVFTLKGLEEHRLSISGEDRKSRLSTSRASGREGQVRRLPALSFPLTARSRSSLINWSPTLPLDRHHWLRACNRLYRLIFMIIPAWCNLFGCWICCLATLMAETVNLVNLIKCWKQGWMLASTGKLCPQKRPTSCSSVIPSFLWRVHPPLIK